MRSLSKWRGGCPLPRSWSCRASGTRRISRHPRRSLAPSRYVRSVMATPVGLAHVAAVSFLAARLAPSGAFWLALAGGAAVARESDLRGLRAGYAGSAAAMLQTVAMVGPLRLSGP